MPRKNIQGPPAGEGRHRSRIFERTPPRPRGGWLDAARTDAMTHTPGNVARRHARSAGGGEGGLGCCCFMAGKDKCRTDCITTQPSPPPLSREGKTCRRRFTTTTQTPCRGVPRKQSRLLRQAHRRPAPPRPAPPRPVDSLSHLVKHRVVETRVTGGHGPLDHHTVLCVPDLETTATGAVVITMVITTKSDRRGWGGRAHASGQSRGVGGGRRRRVLGALFPVMGM